MDDFSNAPVSITEARSERTRDQADWTPRDALISLLRDIDGGKVDVDTLFMAYRKRAEDGNGRVSFSAAGPDAATTVGVGFLSLQNMILAGRGL
jgi:hypothetical protein